MKLNARLVYIRDNNFGQFGWKVKKIKPFYIADAEGLTHDILEHHPRDKGTYVEEIAAYGAMLVYRGNSDWLYRGTRDIFAKATRLGQAVSREILHDMYLYKSSLIGKNLPKKLFKPDNELVKRVAYHANLDFYNGEEDLLNWIYQWLMTGYSRANKIITTCGWDGPYIYEETLRTIEANLFFTENWFEGAEVSVQVDFSRCSTEVIPINCKRMFN